MMRKANSLLGYHYYPDDRHFTDNDLNTWLPILQSLGAKWLTLKGSFRRAIPEGFIRGLIDAGIEPLIHIPSPVIRYPSHSFKTIFNSYAHWGVQSIIVFDRPNMQNHWDANAWSRRDLVERFIDYALPVFQNILSTGMRPVLPPLQPGGDYWDIAFLEGVLRSLVRRNRDELLNVLAISAYSWTFDRPLDWGKGGPDKWQDVQPYHTPSESQDHIGIRIFDWYDAIAKKVLNRTLPIFTVAGGVRSETAPVSEAAVEDQTISIVKLLESGELPSALCNFAFYLLACDPKHPDQASAWFPSMNNPRKVVEAVREFVLASDIVTNKNVDHYLLLPESIEAADIQDFPPIRDLVKRKNPVIGNSPLAAREAINVTLVGDKHWFPSSVEMDLLNAGCKINKLDFDLSANNEDEVDYVRSFISRIVGEGT